jgi:chromosome segregation ATPase
VDLEMKAYLDEQFGRMAERVDKNSRQIEDLRGETRQQIEDLKEDTRHTRVLVEGMWGNVRLIAEGVMGAIEQQEAHRKEIQAAVQEIKTSVVLSYRSLEGRVLSLEDQAERQRHDVFEALRTRFGSSRTGQETHSSLFDDPTLAPYRPKERT